MKFNDAETILKQVDPTEIKDGSFIVPEGVEHIGPDAFYGCGAYLKQITLPSTLISIGDCAFKDCYELAQITLPERLTDIGAGAFGRCTNLAKIILPEGITHLKHSTFITATG